MRPLRFFLVGLWMLGTASGLAGAPADDLASPSQTTRDAAAKILRATYRPHPPADLQRIIDNLRFDMSQDAVLWKLRAFHPEGTISISSGTSRTENYELDGGWLLHCAFGWNEDSWTCSSVLFSTSQHAEGRDTLFSYELYRELGPVPVEPPPGFTGRWVTYYLNGQKSSERRYFHGKKTGEKQYDDDGRPAGRRRKATSDDPMLRIGG